jgi:hypothetical protein
MRRALALGVGALLTLGVVACGVSPPPSGGYPTHARYPDISGPRTTYADQFARAFLNQMQARSFAENREFCGMFGRDAQGFVIATQPLPGGMDSCAPAFGPPGFRAFASYHSHGAFDPGADSEVPSPGDVMADMQEGLIGYVSTPGGRLWRNQGPQTTQICGPGCLVQDPNFVPGLYGPVATRYSVDGLRQRVYH